MSEMKIKWYTIAILVMAMMLALATPIACTGAEFEISSLEITPEHHRLILG